MNHPLQMQQPKYRFYATLLDAFQWYLDSQQDEAFAEFINKINRVPFESEAAQRGTDFNELVDLYLTGKSDQVRSEHGLLFQGSNCFEESIVMEFVNNLSGAIPQIRVSETIDTSYGLVDLYGVIDEVMPACVVVDIKTTKAYNFPKYLRNWQHMVYPYCLNKMNGQDYSFSYMVTDFKLVAVESYQFVPERDTPRLRGICEQLIEFLNDYRHLITDKKVFAQDVIEIAA